MLAGGLGTAAAADIDAVTRSVDVSCRERESCEPRMDRVTAIASTPRAQSLNFVHGHTYSKRGAGEPLCERAQTRDRDMIRAVLSLILVPHASHALDALNKREFLPNAKMQSEIPPELSKQRLQDAPLGSPRFVPGTNKEALTAIFTWWNVLDRHMFVHSPRVSFQTGYLREIRA